MYYFNTTLYIYQEYYSLYIYIELRLKIRKSGVQLSILVMCRSVRYTLYLTLPWMKWVFGGRQNDGSIIHCRLHLAANLPGEMKSLLNIQIVIYVWTITNYLLPLCSNPMASTFLPLRHQAVSVPPGTHYC